MVHEINRAKLERAVAIYRQAQAIEDKTAMLYEETVDEWYTAFDEASDKPTDNLSAIQFCECIMDYNADATADVIADAITSLLGIIVK